MASFKYIVTIQEPRASRCAMGSECTHPDCQPPSPVSSTRDYADEAIADARAEHDRPDGTTITIQRVRVRPKPWGLEEMGDWLPYRRYEVQGGVVRRVDR